MYIFMLFLSLDLKVDQYLQEHHHIVFEFIHLVS